MMLRQIQDFDAFEDKSTNVACYVILTIDLLQLVIPQTQVYRLEPVIDLTRKTGHTDEYVKVAYNEHSVSDLPDNAVGYFVVDGVKVPAYCLTGELEISSTIPISRRICVLLYVESGIFGLLCDHLILVEWADDIIVHPLAKCMCTSHTRLQGLILQDDRVLCMGFAEDLLAYCVMEKPPRTSV